MEAAEKIISGPGLEKLVSLSEFKESDHVQYESARVLATLLKEGVIKWVAQAFTTTEKLQEQIFSQFKTCLGSVSLLLHSNFEILQKEGLAAAKSLFDNGNFYFYRTDLRRTQRLARCSAGVY